MHYIRRRYDDDDDIFYYYFFYYYINILLLLLLSWVRPEVYMYEYTYTTENAQRT